MLTEYIDAAMRHAKYEIFSEDNSYYGEIEECNGVWANEATLEECRDDLRSALEDWLLFSISKQLPIPIIDGIELAIHEVEEELV
jgi:predicted RNase H-like HicB family nuclease